MVDQAKLFDEPRCDREAIVEKGVRKKAKMQNRQSNESNGDSVDSYQT